MTSQREDRALLRLIRRQPFATSLVLKGQWLPNRRMPARTVRNRLKLAHFDNHPLATRPLQMDDNTRPHRSQAETSLPQTEAVIILPWPAMSPDQNLLEHVWYILGRRLQAQTPPVHTLPQIEAALHREWQQLPMQQNRRLTGGIRRRVETVIRARGGFTRY